MTDRETMKSGKRGINRENSGQTGGGTAKEESKGINNPYWNIKSPFALARLWEAEVVRRDREDGNRYDGMTGRRMECGFTNSGNPRFPRRMD